MKHAELPRDRMQLTIGEMEIGETGYTNLAALFVDQERRLWLHPSCDVTREPTTYIVLDDRTMPIGRGADGYVVTLKPREIVGRGTPRVGSIPVAEWLTA
ncbi:hypothetical protein [Nocardia sp. NPDC049707]|uniref:hypothetical protein n=1 Tax=Nocardia sp. NPDC049707 TaxID=3154735 RepID=UPI00343BB157